MNLDQYPTPETDEAQFGTGRVSVAFARRLEQRLAATVEALKRLEKQFGPLFWTSDDGVTVRDGEPDDAEAPAAFCAAWKSARAVLAAVKGDR